MVVEKAVRGALLAWYDASARALPWRAPPGAPRPEPYRVWLSEVMLQQTTAAAAAPRYERFLQRFPTVEALAASPLEAVLEEWAGLGYYARARNLHAAARIVAARGGFPDTEAGLRALPGVGAYTAAAIAAIAFGAPANAVDGNIERVMARLFAVEQPMPAARPALAAHAARFIAAERAADWPQALMDLGALVCTPRAPACARCPIARWCGARAAGDPARYPVKSPRPPRPLRHGVAFWLERASGEALLVRRPPRGLLGGMAALPSTEWRAAPWSETEARAASPAPAAPWREVGAVAHVFTHFELRLAIWRAPWGRAANGLWIPAADVARQGLPTVFRKAAALALSAQP